MSASWVTFLFEAANFLLLAAVLGWFFFRPVRDALERRRNELEKERQAAEEARNAAQEALEQARAQRTDFESTMESLRDRILQEAEAEAGRILESARAQARRERETWKEELVSERRARAHSLALDAAFAAREIVAGLLDRVAGPELEIALLDEACRELEGLRRAGPLSPIVIESSRPLDDATRKALFEAASVRADGATIRIDAALIAGVRVVTARGLVDVSGAGLAAQAERALVARLDREDSSLD